MPLAPHPANEAERLAALRSYAILDTGCEASFEILAGLAARLMGCPIALVSLVDAQRQWCKARHGWDASETPRELAFCSHTVLDPCHPLVVADATLDVRFADNALVTGPAGVRFYAGMPLVDPAGYALGTLCVIDRAPRVIAPQALETLAGLAQAVMATLEMRRALGQARARALAGLIEINARRAAEQAMQRRHRELERSNADLEEFAYAASHDLKAPLRAIAHLAQWIGDDIGATAGADVLGNLKLLQGRATRLQVLLDERLAYSRVGRVGSPVEDVDIAEVVRDVADLLAPPPGFVVACEWEMPVLRTHRTPLRVVLENLIGNALKHHDRAVGRVTVGMRMADGVAEFRVSDDGPGIPPRFHERIFAMFQTLASDNEIESNGIGLATVKQKVLRYGGEIRVECAPPARGTTFVFTWRSAAA